MPWGPIFGVEMITSSRRATFFALRTALGLILLWGLVVSYQEAGGQTGYTASRAANIAANFFGWMAWSLMLCVLLVGPALAAGTLAVERDRRTLEYLLATDLTDWEIIFGKVFSRLLQLTGILAVGLPILAIAMLLGGIAPAQLWQLALFTSALMLAVVAISLVISLHSQKGKDAILRTYQLLLALIVLPTLIFGAFHVDRVVPQISELAEKLHPFKVVSNVCDASGNGQNVWPDICLAVGSYLVLSVALIGYVIYALRKTLVANADGPNVAKQSRRTRQNPPVSNRPLIWKEMLIARRYGWKSWIPVLIHWVPAVAAWIWVLMLALDPPAKNWFVIDCELAAMFIIGFLGTVNLLLVGVRAAALVSTEREKDTWLTLLTTPLELKKVMQAKLLGNLWHARRGFYFVLAIWMTAAFGKPLILLSVPFALVSYAAIAFLASGVGLFCSVVCRTTTRAVLVTLVLLVVYGLVPIVLLMIAMGGGDARDIGALLMSSTPPTQITVPPIWFEEHGPDGFPMFLGWLLGTIADLVVGMIFYSIAIERAQIDSERIEFASSNVDTSSSHATPESQPVI